MENNLFKKIRFEQKKREFKEKAKQKIHNGYEWFLAHKDEIVFLTPIVVGGITTVAKVVCKRVNQRKDEELHDLYCYDRSLGHYWRLKRELSNKEWLEIDKRKKEGERLADILADMRVLK